MSHHEKNKAHEKGTGFFNHRERNQKRKAKKRKAETKKFAQLEQTFTDSRYRDHKEISEFCFAVKLTPLLFKISRGRPRRDRSRAFQYSIHRISHSEIRNQGTRQNLPKSELFLYLFFTKYFFPLFSTPFPPWAFPKTLRFLYRQFFPLSRIRCHAPKMPLLTELENLFLLVLQRCHAYGV